MRWAGALWLLLSVPALAAAPAVTSLGSYQQNLQAPTRVAAGPDGSVYVVDHATGQVVVFDAFGRYVSAVTVGAKPLGIAVDGAGRIYLGDEAAGSVSVFDAQWSLLYKLGAGDGEFQMPNHIALDPVSNTVYVADSKANAIKVYSGATLVNQFGSAGTSAGQFDFPAGLSVGTNGEVFVVDQNNDRVEVFSNAGVYLQEFDFGGMLGPSGRKQGAVVDSAGRLYVVDTYQGCVRAYDAGSGSLLATLGSFGTAAGQLRVPLGGALDAQGRLYVASQNNGRIELFGLDSFVHLTMTPAAGIVAAGADVTLSVVAGGAGIFAYQWLKDGVALDGATNANLTINSMAGGYSVVVTGTSGTYTSSVAQIAVQQPPTIVSDPQSITVLNGTDVSFSVSTVGSALTYQWLYNGRSVDGATNSVVALSDVQPVDNGSYSVIVSNAVGAVSSAPALLTVLVPPLVMEVLGISLQPDQTFALTYNADPGLGYAIEASTNMTDWAVLTSFVNNAGIADFIDTDSVNLNQRFYRLRWVPSK